MSDGPFDLSQPLRTALPTMSGDPGVRIEAFASHEDDGYAMTELHLGSHSGTHMDAPRHFMPRGRTLDTYPLCRFVGRGIVVDLRGLQPDSVIPVETLSRALQEVERWGEPAADGAGGVFALLWLGWDAHFGGELMWRHPYLDEAGARSIVDRGVNLVGTDAASVDRSAVMGAFPAHRTLLGFDVLVVENLRGLEQLGEGPAECVFLPLPIAEADGAPVRAVAWRGLTAAAGGPCEIVRSDEGEPR